MQKLVASSHYPLNNKTAIASGWKMFSEEEFAYDSIKLRVSRVSSHQRTSNSQHIIIPRHHYAIRLFLAPFLLKIAANNALYNLQLNQQRLLRATMPPSPSLPLQPSLRWDSQRSSLSKLIDSMFLNYHNADYNRLEDSIALNERAEYLKRDYQEYEFPGKIAMLSEYYQYHRELPRIFQQEVASIVADYQEDVRNEEYQLVTRKLKDGNFEQTAMTERERLRPVEKIIKNIELSYYNFEQKEVKRVKEKGGLSRNKKSMPTLPLYQSTKNPHPHPHPQHPRLKVTVNNPPPTNPILKSKDMNKLAIKPRSKEQFKKPSLNNSTDSPKNLSRSKSKSNLAMLHPDPVSKRNSVKGHQEPPAPVPPKNKSNPVSLQKTSSSKNVLKKQEIKRPMKGMETMGTLSDKNGLKTMFKKAMQMKKLIKIAR